MFRSEILWVENKRSKLFLTAFFSFVTLSLGVLAFSAIRMAGELGYLGVTPTPSPTPFQPLPPIATPTAVYIEPVSQMIDGLQTYGLDQPLTEEELAGLVEFFNSAPLPMEENAYYITFLASETAYGAFAQDYCESLQSFLLRHVAWMDREIREADPPVEGGLTARRLIVVKDGIWASDWNVRGTDYSAHGLADSDGSWSFIDPYCPECVFYYNQELRLDFGLTHEWVHAVFKLPDHYTLDFHSQFDLNGVLAEIPESWRFYWAGRRPDISRNDFAMGGGGSTLRRYSALQLEERRSQGINHDKERTWREANFLSQVPESVVWDLGPDLAGAPILVFKSQPCPPDYLDSGASACKILNPVPIFQGWLDERGRIAVGNLFPVDGDIVPYKEGVLFLTVQSGDELQFRWLDIRDFNLAVWEGFGEAVVMRFNLASADDNPENFAWEVSYERLDP